MMVSALKEAEQLLPELTRSEKAQLLQWVVRDLGDAFPAIESRPGVCGGEPCIVRTRIPVWVLEQARRWAYPKPNSCAHIRPCARKTLLMPGPTCVRIATKSTGCSRKTKPTNGAALFQRKLELKTLHE